MLPRGHSLSIGQVTVLPTVTPLTNYLPAFIIMGPGSIDMGITVTAQDEGLFCTDTA